MNRRAIMAGSWGLREAGSPVQPLADAPPPALPPSLTGLLEPPEPARPPRAPVARLLSAIVLAAIGVALAGVGMVETVGYSWRVGGEVFAALAVSADLLGLVMPSVAATFGRRAPLAATAAVLLWVIGCVVTVANLSGYIGGHDDTFTASRQVQALNRSDVLANRERLRAERAGIHEFRPVAALKVAVKAASRRARPALQEALAIAERRDAVDAELARPLEAGNTTTADPSASVLSRIAGATISEEALRRVRLLSWLLLPLCGGGVLSLAFALRRV